MVAARTVGPTDRGIAACAFDFRERMVHGASTMTAEDQRTRLIGEIASVLRDDPMPADARAAALTLIGWLARRMPGEPPSTDGVTEMICRAAALTCGPAPRRAMARPRRNVRGSSDR
jgi:hypothetical protein